MAIRRVHIVYPHGERSSTPDAIGRELGRYLAGSYEVVFHDWTDFERIPADRSAAIIGHAHPVPFTTFRRSIRQSGWGRRVLMQPFVTDLAKVGYLAGVLPHVDGFVALCGRHWARRLPTSPLRCCAPLFRQQDLAVDATDFPFLVDVGRPPGQRALVYIGRDAAVKNLEYLEEIARRRPEWRVAWIGPPGRDRPALEHLGPLDFRSADARALLSSFDMMVTVGRADANPTTVLEAMSWGLVPVCTPESGYEGYDGIVNVPLDDVEGALRVLDHLQVESSERLAALRRANRERVESEFTWTRFGEDVEAAILDQVPRQVRLPLAARVWTSTRWWLTSLAPSNRAGLRQSFDNLVRRAGTP